ncbi:ribonuclease J [Enhydrobacter sp.]|jgi:ribonuclease J|uniref:ribonuclease J n=1 Tax=Enhydrobacter sp. TaxID=1894999 RepID=UPI00260934D8|nr:ribonuclease J [Enhydrobacter sp.]WIM13997.1 MAG: Ribonuclease J (endonuclease and 5' exonuclease) [Enhydrobacter sp.]
MTVPGADELLFLALGGAGEIGMNLNLYGHAGKWLMVDLGIAFGDDTMPGIDVVMPDPAFIEERRDDLAGIVLTHAHEDHLGAVADLWPRLRAPVYATPFAASVLRRKLAEAALTDAVPVTEIALGAKFTVAPFELEMITMTHSIPEPNALAIRTGLGTVFHTGDWKIDPEPLLGETTDEATLKRIGEEGALAMVCDSTNVFVEGEAGSEATVRANLEKLVKARKCRVAVTCFASNVARVESIAKAAVAAGRHPVLAGRAVQRMVEAAQECGYLLDFPECVPERDAGCLPRDKVLYICTGSQGESRASMAKIANGEHRDIVLEAGDTAVFSSRVIPGNERAVGRLQNELLARGVEVVTDKDVDIHVSGHPARDELVRVYQWVRPRIAVPVHGEIRHMVEHASLAKACQVPETVLAPNGTLVRLAPGPATIVDHVHAGRLARDGDVVAPVEGEALRERRKLLWNGSASATLVIDSQGRPVASPKVSLRGIADTEGELIQAAVTALEEMLADLNAAERRDDDRIEEAARQSVRRVVRAHLGKKPLTDVHIVRI